MATYTTYDVNIYTHEDDDTTITVSEDGDGCGMINVKASTDFYGKLDFSMDKELARQLALGILAQLKFMEK